MVSSRWVAGSSIGTRAFSASSSMNRLAAARTRDGTAAGQAMASGVPSMPPSERLPVARTRTVKESSSAGSVNAATVTSRLDPMPSKLEPVSSAASTSANRPSPSRPAKATRSPVKPKSGVLPSSGSSSAATSTLAVSTTGAARNTIVVVRL